MFDKHCTLWWPISGMGYNGPSVAINMTGSIAVVSSVAPTKDKQAILHIGIGRLYRLNLAVSRVIPAKG